MSYAATITPQNGRLESAVVALMVSLVAGMTYTYAMMLPDQPAAPELLDWQVSAFSDLSPEDQAIHSALNAASGEITWYNYRYPGMWPSVEQLEMDLVSPFYKDNFWETNGRVQWQFGVPLTSDLAADDKSNDQGATYYHGSGGTIPGQSAYLLLMAHAHAGMQAANAITVWVHKDPNAPYPEVTRIESLIRAGWKQVVAYSGADEVERLRGEGS